MNGQPTSIIYEGRICDVLIREFKPLRHGTHILATRAGSSAKTAQNWLYRLSAPSGAHLMRLMAACPAVRVAVDQMVEEQQAAIIERMSKMDQEAFAARERLVRFADAL